MRSDEILDFKAVLLVPGTIVYSKIVSVFWWKNQCTLIQSRKLIINSNNYMSPPAPRVEFWSSHAPFKFYFLENIQISLSFNAAR